MKSNKATKKLADFESEKVCDFFNHAVQCPVSDREEMFSCLRFKVSRFFVSENVTCWRGEEKVAA